MYQNKCSSHIIYIINFDIISYCYWIINYLKIKKVSIYFSPNKNCCTIEEYLPICSDHRGLSSLWNVKVIFMLRGCNWWGVSHIVMYVSFICKEVEMLWWKEVVNLDHLLLCWGWSSYPYVVSSPFIKKHEIYFFAYRLMLAKL